MAYLLLEGSSPLKNSCGEAGVFTGDRHLLWVLILGSLLDPKLMYCILLGGIQARTLPSSNVTSKKQADEKSVEASVFNNRGVSIFKDRFYFLRRILG